MTARRSGARARAPRAPRPAKRDKDFYRLRLYVAWRTARAQGALRNLEAICETHLRGKYQIEVVDLLGDLSNIERVLVGLDLRPLPKKAGP
jgi:circadian clock protein KaiB